MAAAGPPGDEPLAHPGEDAGSRLRRPRTRGLVAEQNGLTLADVRAAVADEIAKGVDVDVPVQPNT